MVADWLLAAASTGGQALVGAAASDVWQTARSGVVTLFGIGGRRRQQLAARWADETAAEVERSPADERDDLRERLVQAWTLRLKDLIEEYPEAGEDLRSWAEQVRAQLPAPRQAWVHTYVARDHAHQYNAPHGTLTVNHQQGPGSASSS